MAAAEKIVRQSTARSLKVVERPYPHLERALAGRNTRIADLSHISEQLDAPLWILFIPGLSDHPEMLERASIKRLNALVQNYLAMDERSRHGVDVLAEHQARS